MYRCLPALTMVVLLAGSASTASAQYRTTASRIRDLEKRFDEFLLLQEGLLQQVEQIDRRLQMAEGGLGGMESRMQAIQHRLQAGGSASSWAEARDDFRELQQRVGRLEQWKRNARGAAPSQQSLAWAVAEQDILSARTRGLQGRVQTLQRRAEQSQPTAFQPVVLQIPADLLDRLQATGQAGAARLVIEVHITTDSNGRITGYQVAR